MSLLSLRKKIQDEIVMSHWNEGYKSACATHLIYIQKEIDKAESRLAQLKKSLEDMEQVPTNELTTHQLIDISTLRAHIKGIEFVLGKEETK